MSNREAYKIEGDDRIVCLIRLSSEIFTKQIGGQRIRDEDTVLQVANYSIRAAEIFLDSLCDREGEDVK